MQKRARWCASLAPVSRKEDRHLTETPEIAAKRVFFIEIFVYTC